MKLMGLYGLTALVAAAGCCDLDIGAGYSETADSAPAARTASFRAAPQGLAKSASAANSGGYFKPQGDRLMAYTSSFTLTVRTAEDAVGFIKAEAEKLGGYVLTVRNRAMTVKVPTAQADNFVRIVSGAGKMSDFTLSAEDMTDTIADLGVRLDNLKKLRDRLAALLSQANQVEDMLKVEKELNRVTTEIERLTAQLQNSRKRVDFVTFNITLTAEEPEQADAGTLRYFPFLQDSLASTTAGDEEKPLFGLAAPTDFITAATGFRRVGVYTAVTADDCLLVMQERDIPDDGTLEFWSGMFVRALAQYHGFTVGKVEKATLDGGEAVLIPAEKNTVAGKFCYCAVISIDRKFFGSDRLRIVEFSGAEKPFSARKAAVIEKIR
ncbi:MAG: DUF4349 domain-containing protein [Lentisphaeria bacterium]|nr:DUF4349 domain-containing protein [Lentisphaeria bacterium]